MLVMRGWLGFESVVVLFLMNFCGVWEAGVSSMVGDGPWIYVLIVC